MHCPYRREYSAFTLVETLVTLGLMALLFSLLLPAIQRVRESHSRIACLMNLKQIGLALHHYHADLGRLPPLPLSDHPQSYLKDPNFRLNWLALILPFVEEEPLWAQSLVAVRVEPRPFINPPHVGLATVIKLFACPTDTRLLDTHGDRNGITAAFTSYMGISGSRNGVGVFGSRPGIRFSDIADGTSNTLMVGERPPPDSYEAGWWYTGVDPGRSLPFLRGPEQQMLVDEPGTYPGDPAPCLGPFRFGPGRTENACDRWHFWSLHPGGANFALADGSSRYVPYSAMRITAALASRAAGEVVDLSEFD
jgi:prepilin-type processing-associated H-X9-DG protein